MKTYSLRSLAIAAVSVALFNPHLHAETVQSGSMTMSFDELTFGSLGLTNINFFNQGDNTLTGAQIQSQPGMVAWTNLNFGINGASVPVVAGRGLQATDLNYDPLNFNSSLTGQIGLGGATRWDSFPSGVLVLGDYSLKYDAARVGGVYSGWYLTNNFSFSSIAFDLANITAPIVSASGFSFSGDLYVKSGSGLNILGFPADTNYGTFSLTTSTVPEPSSILLLLGSIGALLFLRRRRQTAV